MNAYRERPEYPRPDFERDHYLSLNGTWEFAFDDADVGLTQGWEKPGRRLGGHILVPFAYQCRHSGVFTDEIHEVIWYRRAFTVADEMKGRRVWLRFGAVDFSCAVWVNGRAAGTHEGGYDPFGFDISKLLSDGENDVCLRVVDRPDKQQPRGKQYWERRLMGCWYTPVSGIWQSVWLEATGPACFDFIHVTPDIGAGTARVEMRLMEKPAAPLRIHLNLLMGGMAVCEQKLEIMEQNASTDLDVRIPDIGKALLWSPDSPSLYELTVSLACGADMHDEVRTWFGMRHVEVRDGQVFLNHHPIYQRLVLNQGYWPDTLLTPPDGGALRQDIRWMKDLGFNGVRMHQKMEDPRFYHLCDREGLLVWAELPAAYEFGPDMLRNCAQAMQAFIRRDYNHPSVITWVPLNESWGVGSVYHNHKQQAAARMLTQLCRALDGTRLISANDGWEQTETDICALHDYARDGETLLRHFQKREEVEKEGCDLKKTYAHGVTPTGKEALLITEYGGIAMQNAGIQGEIGGMETWGYHDKAADQEDFLRRYADVTGAIRQIPYCRGYCYTQLTDVMQEINGLLTPGRKPKADITRIREINRDP